MAPRALAEIIRAARLDHLRPGVGEQLANMDEATLRRLALTTRRYCRDQLRQFEEPSPASAWVPGKPH